VENGVWSGGVSGVRESHILRISNDCANIRNLSFLRKNMAQNVLDFITPKTP
jgi:hypothetical protein